MFRIIFIFIFTLLLGFDLSFAFLFTFEAFFLLLLNGRLKNGRFRFLLLYPLIFVQAAQLCSVFVTGRYIEPLTLWNLSSASSVGAETQVKLTFIAVLFLAVSLPPHRLRIQKVRTFAWIMAIWGAGELCFDNFPLRAAAVTAGQVYNQLAYNPAYDDGSRFYRKNVVEEGKSSWQNEMTKKKNVILIFAEGMSSEVISEKLTPHTFELRDRSVSFENYYNHTAATFRGIRGQLISGFQLLGGSYGGQGIAEINKKAVDEHFKGRTEKTAAGETEQAPAVEEAALLPTSEESVETIAEAKPKRKYTRRKGVEKKTEKKSVHPKGYSVNGRKLGRPRKVNSVNEMEAYAPNAVLLKEGNASVKIEGKDAVTEEAKAEVVGTTAFETPFPTEMPLEKEDGAAVSETVPENSAETEVQEEPAFKSKKEQRLESRRQMVLPTQAEAAALEMGKALPFKLLYKTKEGPYLSERVLNSLNPEGVVVPYRISGRFFVLRIFEEAEVLSAKEAAACAKKLERIGDKPWMLLTPQQKESCKAVKIELNEVIKKVGGDLFEGNYLTNPPSYGNKPAQKVRFATEL